MNVNKQHSAGPRFTSKNATINHSDNLIKQSGIIFNGKLILTSGLVLEKVLKYNDDFKEITENLNSRHFVAVNNNTKFQHLSELRFDVVYKNDNSDELIRSTAKIIYILESRNVKNAINTLFKDLQHREISNFGHEGIWFSSFILLTFEDFVVTEEIIRNYFTNLVKSRRKNKSIEILDDIVTVTTPFGNDCFHGSVNVGMVSNIFGTDNCLMLLTTPLAFGCEGGAVYDKNLDCIGMVLGSSLVYENDNIYFTLAAGLEEIFKSFLTEPIVPTAPIGTNIALHNYSVLIDDGSCYGTGCLIKINQRKLIITCAHVVRGSNIVCYTINGRIYPKLIYRTPKHDSVFDIAILEVEDGQNHFNNFCELANYQPYVTQKVYCVGFPIFKRLGTHQPFKPSIFNGRVVKYSEGAMFTDCSIQNGQSGGPVFDANNKLIAIMVSNNKNSGTGTIYPNNNMCVPVFDIYKILEKFTKHDDITHLGQLEAPSHIKRLWQLEPPSIKCKI